ncbi:hypothetical protein [Elizabethkingia anophelis]|uniref:hypothetical protein n=1 Tax=Elizabethkingia anophelis TaxID=1117645 RepID=UPI0038912991
MAKNIVFPFLNTHAKFELKKLALFYDKIYIANIESSKKSSKLITESEQITMLQEKGIVKSYSSSISIELFNRHLEDFSIQESVEKLNVTYAEYDKKFPEDSEEKVLFYAKEFMKLGLNPDFFSRIDALALANKDNTSEYFPGLKGYETLENYGKENKKEQIIQFILNDIPQPDINTDWGQIVDYRNDETVKNKYLALISWINKMSHSNSTLAELKEEYDYLYSEYMTQFKLHKMKYSDSKVEMILNTTDTFLENFKSGRYISAVRGLFQFNVKKVSLLQEESKIPGKEIAYIFHTNKKFSK